MRKMTLLFGTLAIAAISVAGAKAQPGVPFSILFDGGYAWIHDQTAGTLDIAGLAQHHDGIAHDMELMVTRGTIEQADLPPTDSPVGKYWSLKGWDVTLPSYGAEPKSLRFPERRQQASACAPVVDYSPEANNLTFLPSLNDLMPGAVVDETPAKFESRVLVDRGRISIRGVTPCWEFRKPGDAAGTGKRQPIVAGIAGLKYSLESVSQTFEIRLVSRSGGPSKSIRIKAATAGNAYEEITLRIGHHLNMHPDPMHPLPIIPVGKVMSDFQNFYASLTTVGPTEQVLPYKVQTPAGFTVSPGGDCGSLIYVKR